MSPRKSIRFFPTGTEGLCYRLTLVAILYSAMWSSPQDRPLGEVAIHPVHLIYMWYTFLAASLFYLFGAYIAYDATIKASPWFLPIGIVVGIASNLIWLYVTKITTDNKELFIYGLAWDVMMMAAYIIIPMLLFDVRLDWKQTVGTILVVIGLILTKL